MLAKLIKLRLMGMLTRQSANRKKRSSVRGMLLLYGFLLLYCGGFFGFTFYQLFSMLAKGTADSLNWYFFSLAGMMAFGLSLFFSIFTAKSELFEAKDNDLLLSLPLKPRTILLSRMSVLLLIEMIFSLLVLIPAALAWFSVHPINAAQLALFVVGGLLLPLLGSAIACLIGWLLALLTARLRNKSLMTVIFSLGFLAIYFLLISKAQSYFTLLVTNQEKIAGGIAVWGFLFKWFGDGVASLEVLSFCGYAAVCIGVFAISVALISRGFIRITTQKHSTRRKHAGKLSYQAHGINATLLRRELKHFFASAPYLLNCGLGLIMALAAAVFLFIKRTDGMALVASLQESIPFPPYTIAFLGAVAVCFLCTMSTITAPSISIEGKTIWILRSLPISPRKVLAAKLKMHLLLCVPSTVLLCVALGLILMLDILGWAVLLTLPLLMTLLSGAFGLMMNLLLPKLDWVNETIAVKQSGAAMITMFTPWLYLGIFGVLLFSGALTGTALLITLLAVTAAACLFCLLWLYRRGPKRFEQL